ncbi:hypothetical protein QPK87_37465 [Kamptonema cortianum]|nr:hypothetical protein [Geitlerinema splendidum]MDK3162197.1 hypothetical protein [Kamptonema cortianum]
MEKKVESEVAPTSRRVHPLIKVWFFFHLFVLFSRTMPLPTPEQYDRVASNEPIQSAAALQDWLIVQNVQVLRNKDNFLPFYTESTGLWQFWDMFAPNPARVDYWLDAEVTYQDGSTKIVEYPRMKNMSLFQKFMKERYRKYSERLSPDEYRWKWPHTAYWMAVQAWTDHDNPPVRIALRRHFRTIQPPGTPTPDEYEEFTFYNCAIDRIELNRMAGKS